MRKLFVDASPLTDPNVSGIGHTTLSLVKALSSSAHNLELVLVVSKGKKPMLKRWGFNERVKVKEIKIPSRIFNALNKFNILPPMDLMLGRGIYLFTNYRNWPLIYSKSLTFIYDLGYLKVPETVAPKNRAYMARNMKNWIKRTDIIIAMSAFTKNEIVENLKVSPDKIKIIRGGVDKEIFKPSSKEAIVKLKKAIGVKGEYFVFVGNIEPRKNLVRLIDAYKKLPEDTRQKYALLLVGGFGWLHNEILAAINKAQKDGFDVIKPDRFVTDDELPALYSGATALVHPAIYEGFGISPLQAMACGCPVVVSKVSSLPEVVGKAGLYCEPLDTADIAKAMQRIIKEGKAIVNKEAEPQLTKFSWVKSAEELIKIINSI